MRRQSNATGNKKNIRQENKYIPIAIIHNKYDNLMNLNIPI